MRKALLFAVVAAGLAGLAVGEETGKIYRFLPDDAKHTVITFTSETEVETIDGRALKVDGQTWLDFDGLKGKCSIQVPVDSLRTGIDKRDEHLRSETWLDADKYPQIELVSDGFDLFVKNKDKGIYQAKFKGRLTIHGVTKDLETTAKVVKMNDEQNKVMGGGEWAHVVASFDVTLKDFDIKVPPGAVVAKVNPTWTVKFDCYGTTAEAKK